MRNYLKQIIKDKNYLDNLKIISSNIKKLNILDEIINCTSYITGENIKITERLYHIFNDIFEEKECKRKECNNKVKFISFNQGYSEYCSRNCSRKSIEVQNKRNKTIKERYNVENISQIDEVKKKKIETSKRNYGVNYYLQSEKGKLNFENRCIEKYGVRRPLQNSEIKRKQEITCIERFGVKDPNKLEQIQEKRKNTNLKKFGVEEATCSEKIKRKMIEGSLKNYGTNHPMKNEDVKNKCMSSWRNNFFIPKFKKYLKFLGIELVDEKYIDCFFSHKWRCIKCENIFEHSWNSIQQGYNCTNCYPRNLGFSRGEKEVLNFINSIINCKIVENDRITIKPKELDIYIPDKKIAIEYNGIYMHSEKFNLDKNYHINKTKLCNNLNIRLIHIFEDEWVYKQDIVKQCLKYILGLYDGKKIYARKCKIQEINTKDKNNFLDKYHLLGRDYSNIKLGAFYDNKLVSVMTFSKGSISKGTKFKDLEYELNRFCTCGINIPGISSKLLKFFERNYLWRILYSYSDIRWFEGKMYEKLGFNLCSITQPNYWYIDGCNRIHRFNLRKRPDEPKDIPEWILRRNQGYYRIWDCGHKKYVKYNDLNEN